MIASDKCNELAQSLSSMSTTIPYEDVQTATNQITQCSSNVLTVTSFLLIIVLSNHLSNNLGN
jgi:hypothetical protein